MAVAGGRRDTVDARAVDAREGHAVVDVDLADHAVVAGRAGAAVEGRCAVAGAAVEARVGIAAGVEVHLTGQAAEAVRTVAGEAADAVDAHATVGACAGDAVVRVHVAQRALPALHAVAGEPVDTVDAGAVGAGRGGAVVGVDGAGRPLVAVEAVAREAGGVLGAGRAVGARPSAAWPVARDDDGAPDVGLADKFDEGVGCGRQQRRVVADGEVPADLDHAGEVVQGRQRGGLDGQGATDDDIANAPAESLHVALGSDHHVSGHHDGAVRAGVPVRDIGVGVSGIGVGVSDIGVAGVPIVPGVD